MVARAVLALVSLGVASAAPDAAREVVTVPGWPSAKGFPLSFGIKADGMVYASGLGGLDMHTMKKAGGGVEGETKQALVNLKELLAAAGSSLENVVACSVSLADIKRDFAAMNGAYAAFFKKDPPSRVCVEVGQLAGGSLVEIKCMAALSGSHKEVVQVPGWPHIGQVPLSMVTKVNGMVYPSGMQGLDMAARKLVPGGAGPETTQTLANIKAALKAAGSDLDLVLGCEVSLAHVEDFEAMNAAYAAAFGGGKGRLGGLPSRVAVKVGGLAGTGVVEIRCVAATEELAPKVVKVPGWPKLPFPFSTATAARGMLYLSGQQGFDFKTMKLVEGGIGAETTQTLKNIDEVVRAAGGRIEDVVECEVSLKSIEDFKDMNAAYAAFWPKDPPSRIALQVGGLVGKSSVEIKCLAAGVGMAEDGPGEEMII